MKHNQFNRATAARTGKGILDLISKETSISTIGANSALEEVNVIANIWKGLLGHSKFTSRDDFFNIGGNSLKAVQLVSRISHQLGVNIDLSDIFSNPTLAQQNILIEQRKQFAFLSPSIVTKSPRPESIPLSYSQERLWFIDQLEGSVGYHIPALLRLVGKLDKRALAGALKEVLRRHEVLRTVYVEEEGIARQEVQEAGRWELGQKESNKEDKAALSQYIEAAIRAPFDLGKDYMLRAVLINQEEEEHLLLVTLHHIASDGWSMPLIVQEVASLYRSYSEGKPSTLQPLELQYADYAIWQRNYLQGEVLEKKLSYWKQKLSGVSALELPLDYPRPAVQTTRGGSIKFTIEKQFSEQLQDLSRREGATLYMTLLAGLNVLLYRYSGQQDISIGTPVANRMQQEVEELVGFFVNTLALRSQVSGEESFKEQLAQVKATMLEAYEHQEVPFEKVVEAVVKERDLGRTPLFQVLFVLQNTPETGKVELTGLQLSGEPVAATTSKFELTFSINETSTGLQGSVDYNTDLFKEETIIQLVGHFKTLLASILQTPGEKIAGLRMLSEEEEEQLLKAFNDTSVAYPRDKTLVTIIEERAEKRPEATAILFKEEKLTYRELNERSNQLANYLRKRGVEEETLVPVLLERSQEMIVAILGILKAGGAYVPVDAEYPAERISYMLKDTGATIVVSSKESLGKLEEVPGIEIIDIAAAAITKEETANLEINISPNNLAYVIYTSGSTGRPKGVMIEHQAVVDHCFGLIQRAGLEECKSFALFAPLVFDAGHAIIFSSLFLGASLNVLSKDQITDGERLSAYLEHHPVDCIKIVPSVWLSYASDQHKVVAQKVMIFGGEAFSAKIPGYLKKSGYAGRVYNHYGPTEATIGKTIHEVNLQKEYTSVPIGKPFSNTQLYIADSHHQLVAAGVAGELYIAGEGLARGYLNQPELTKEKFITDPFAGKEGKKAYKTGDKVKWNKEGEIEYLGRIDEQVKIRGHRIELGEIENVLVQIEGVRDAAVTAIADSQGNKQLSGYIVARENFDKQKMLAELREKIPGYMIPAVWMEIEQMPLTANGKIDKKALPKPGAGETGSREYIAPKNETEEKLAATWQELLGVEKIGRGDNFFELGGHSLLAMRLISAIRRQLGREVPVKSLFLYPTIGQLSEYLQANTHALLPEIAIAPRPGRIPLSFSQERLWFIDQLEGSIQYHLPTVLRLRGRLNKQALSHSLQELVNRHEVLRTVFKEQEGQSWQYIKEKDGNELQITDGTPYKKDQEGLNKYIQKLIKTPFDLSGDNMLRVTLIELGEEDGEENSVLVATMHHIASDAWSTSILVKEVVELYNAYTEQRTAILPEMQLQYADYSIWQRAYLRGEVLDKKIKYWKEKLDSVATLQLPTDYKRPAVQSTRGAISTFKIEKALSEQVQSLSRAEGTTLFITLQAVYKTLLYRYSGQSDISIGTSIARREQQQLEGLIGFFVNTLALRDEVSGEQTFAELLQQVRTTTMEAYEHQEVPFEKVVEVVIKERDKSRSPLFQVMLVLRNTPEVPELKLGEVSLSAEGHEHTTVKFELTFFINETANGLQGNVQYCSDLYSKETIERMAQHFTELLHSVVKNPQEKIGKLQMLSAAEKQTLTKEYNQATVSYPKQKSVVTLFEEEAAKNPGGTAVVFEEEKISYQEINERANQLANHLRKKGVEKETLVPLFIERGIAMIVGMLGIMKAGGAYVPIDTEYPSSRISYMLEDIEAKLVVSSKESQGKLEAIEGIEKIAVIAIDEENKGDAENKESKENQETTVNAGQLAYVIYTSGSTGQPKGAKITHRNLTDYVYGLKAATPIEECKSFALVSTIATDLGNTVLYSSLLTGGTLHVFSKEATSDVYGLHKYFKDQQVDCLKIVPSHWKALSKEEALLLPKKLLIFGGEALHKEVAAQIEETGTSCTVVNHYGPTETTIGKLLHVVEKGRKYGNTIPIGQPFSNTQVYVLSKEMELCPVGVPGQLYIGGDGVSGGYVHNEVLTNQKFIKDPFSKEAQAKMYVTGDVVKYLEDGNIEFIGRADDQVKIRGYRVELGEIESILQQSETVKQAVVLAREDNQGNKRLVGYIVAPEAGDFDKAAIEKYLENKLPEYMVPQLWVELEQMPLTGNGKVDRKSLPEPEAQINTRRYEAPGNETQTKLAALWQEILEVEQVGIHDDFFELGGHSLLAIRLISVIRKELGAEVKIGDVFDYPTIALLSGRITTAEEPHALLPEIAIAPRPGRIPLSFSQERLWFIDQLEGSIQYHLPTVLRLRGRLNKQALSHSLQELVNRHEVLRTVFKEQEGQSWQYIKEKDGNELQITDGTPYKKDQEGLNKYIQKLIKTPFDLSGDNMLRVTLIELGEEDGEENSVLVATMHHIASDAWSTSILVKEVVELYNAYTEQRTAILPEMQLQYADYSIWQRAYLRGEVLDKKIKYWKEKLDSVATLQLPTDYKRPAVQSTRGAISTFKIEKALSEQVQSLSRAEGTTLFITLQAVYKTLLYRYSGQSDISIGTSIARREQQQLEGLIGFFVNTLALRDEVSGEQTFAELLQQVRTTTMEAYEHQEVPFEKVVEVVIKERDKSRSPLFQVMLVLRNTPEVPELKLGEVSLSAEGHEHTTVKFELTFFINETANGLQGNVQYCSDLYSKETIERMAQHFTELLHSVVKNPQEKIGKLQMLSAAEKQTLTKEYNQATVSYPKQKSVVTLFEEEAAKNPGGTAVVFEEEKISYQEINERANQLANHLRKKGVEKETLVPLFIERGIAMIVGMLGIMKAGGAYVPIDTEYPSSRISYMLEDIEAKLVVSSKESQGKLEAIEGIEKIAVIAIDEENKGDAENKESKENQETTVNAGQLAYVIYTSGSTGQPKGAKITHRNLTDYVYGLKAATPIEECKSFALVSTIATDLGNTVLYSSLLTGGTLHVFSKEATSDVYGLHKYFKDQQVDCLKIVPSHWKALSKEEALLLPKKLLIFGGEALHKEVAAQIEETGTSCTVVNHYGPTETTIGKLLHVVEKGRKYGNTIPIGQPFSNTQVYVLSKEMELCPVGVPGQLYIGGDGVSGGYVHNEVLTNQKFIKDPFSKEAQAKMYVTGDVVKYLEDGNIEFIGRADDQVKIRGYRVELGEIESILQQSETVKQAVVLAREDNQGNKRLVGYIVAPEAGDFDKAAIEKYLENKLPEYMVPQLWVELEQMPLTGNGKVDRKSLPEPEAQINTRRYEAPGNETQTKLAALWQEILEVEQVGIHDDFFELGGHSLLAVRMIYFIERDLLVSIPINIIFEFTTINSLSKYLDLQLEVQPAVNNEASYKTMSI